MLKNKLSRMSFSRRKNVLLSMAAAVSVGLVGYVLIASFAAGTVYNIEPENVFTGNASKVTDPQASGGSALLFGKAATDPGGGGTTAATQLRVAADNRSFVKADGTPFFWMGDTAWGLYINLSRSETVSYLQNRADKGINVIQAVGLRTPSGGNGPNVYGDSPYRGNLSTLAVTEGSTPPSSGNGNGSDAYDYWDHVEFSIQEAAKRDMYIAFLPAWGKARQDGEITSGNAEAYGRFLGERFGKKYTNVIWVMGGDDNEGFAPEVWRPLAKGISIGATGGEDYSKTFMSYHPGGGKNSVDALHNEPWLDFNMYQSGHRAFDGSGGSGVWNNINKSFSKTPPKPYIDGEPVYEEHPYNFSSSNGYATAFDVRASAYAPVFSGSAGHTYGHHNVWNFRGAHRGGAGADPKNINWQTALNGPGATQMGHLSKLMDSRQEKGALRVRDDSVLASGLSRGNASAIMGLRGSDNSYLMVYSMQGRAFSVNTSKLSGTTLKAYWFNPRTGAATDAPAPQKANSVQFTTPGGGDWVLVIDDTSKGYGKPGA